MSPAELQQGPIFIGAFLNILLYGVMLSQSYWYFNNFKQDKTWMKIFVVFLLLANTVNGAFSIMYLYDCLVIHFDDPSYLAQSTWVLDIEPASTGVLSTAVQSFFAWRIYVLTGNILLVVGVCFFTFTSGAMAIATAISAAIDPHFVDFPKHKYWVLTWLSTSSLVDIVITVALVLYLRKNKSGFAPMDDVVDHIIRVTVQTGMVTAVLAALDFILFLASPTGAHLLVNMVLSKLYTNCLLSSLNARATWKMTASRQSKNTTGHMVEFKPATRSQDTALTKSVDGPERSRITSIGGGPEVFIQVESHEMVDLDKPGSTLTYASDWDDKHRSKARMV